MRPCWMGSQQLGPCLAQRQVWLATGSACAACRHAHCNCELHRRRASSLTQLMQRDHARTAPLQACMWAACIRSTPPC